MSFCWETSLTLHGRRSQGQTVEDFKPAIIVSVQDQRHPALITDRSSISGMARELRYAVTMGGAILTVPERFHGILGYSPPQTQVLFAHEPTSVFGDELAPGNRCELLCFPTACSSGFIRQLKPHAKGASVANFLAALYGVSLSATHVLNQSSWQPGITTGLQDVRLVAGNAYVIHTEGWSTPLSAFVYLGEPTDGSHLVLCGNRHGFPLVFEYETIFRLMPQEALISVLRPQHARMVF